MHVGIPEVALSPQYEQGVLFFSAWMMMVSDMQVMVWMVLPPYRFEDGLAGGFLFREGGKFAIQFYSCESSLASLSDPKPLNSTNNVTYVLKYQMCKNCFNQNMLQ